MRRNWLTGLMTTAVAFSAIGASTLALSGCQAPPKQTPPPPVTPADQFPGIKASFEAANPKSLMGRVTAVKADAMLIAVGDMDPTKVTIGDVVSVVDAKYDVLCNGTITSISQGTVIVTYATPTGPRGPQVDDLVIHAVLQ